MEFIFSAFYQRWRKYSDPLLTFKVAIGDTLLYNILLDYSCIIYKEHFTVVLVKVELVLTILNTV